MLEGQVCKIEKATYPGSALIASHIFLLNISLDISRFFGPFNLFLVHFAIRFGTHLWGRNQECSVSNWISRIAATVSIYAF